MGLNIGTPSQLRQDYYVYHLIDPNSNQVFYVGKGCKSRMFAHEKCVRNNNHCERNPILFYKIRKILAASQKIGYIKIQENLTEPEAMALEVSEIKKYGRRSNKTGILCNITNGGEGMSGYIHSTRTKRYMSKLHSGTKNPFHGKRHSVAVLQRLTKSAMGNSHAKGMVHTSKTKKKLSQMNLGKTVSLETRRRMSRSRARRPTKPIFQFDKNNLFVQRWASASNAAKVLGFSKQCLSNCLRGKQKTSKGFIWKYE